MICFITGHRTIPANHIIALPEILDNTLEELIAKGVTRVRGGGALGFDTLAELKVLEKKKKYPFLKLDLVLPCRDQTRGWSQRNKDIYNFILERADSVSFVSEVYTPSCMHERNRRLADGSQFCVAYLTSGKGGTAYTCKYAEKIGVPIINTADLIKPI